MQRTRADAKLPNLARGSGSAPEAGDGSGLPLKPTLSSRAYRQIRQMLLDGTLAEGMLVSEQSLAAKLGISRTPVREAIRRLRAERIVEQVHRVGTTVRKPSPEELVELYDLREALEVFAAGRAASGAASEKQLDRLGRYCDAMMILARRLRAADRGRKDAEAATVRGQFFAADMAFHTELMGVTGNAAMLNLIRETRVFTQIFTHRRHPFIDDLTIAHVYRHHRRILNAIRHGNAAEAGRRMADHIRASKEGMLPFLREREAAGAVEVR
ncbi:GntR family transcriptional regulator [Phycisphaera mikurensis]|uniref:Putative GntR family transcriptional regulator n=1 Tax=Phycisphaera mikurensis (strain NBRC 102666 / KCTC 22515 / FYK2301M01) TaxID=1142394 RepID=I0IDH1_PHYMF|nr:GntR family transcriptional regulator [Phycisphaera mikurensis]MBB6441130.1 DNA-binding GntR family transcriptional regulator [Phycisphaera mikurensis]BAM03309.1 putative GntR family transcriptional regulator [Phycisphaera mikurensis NBRC 102666]